MKQMNKENKYEKVNGIDLLDYYNYLLSLQSEISMEVFLIKDVLDKRVLKNIDKEQVAEHIVPQEYFKTRKKEIGK